MEFIFWLFIFLIFYTYLIYPLLIDLIPRKLTVQGISDEPSVSVIIPAYNEELLIQKKIHSIFNSNYPKEKFEVIIYSDGSNDATEELVHQLQNQYPELKIICNRERKGKSSAVNELVTASKHNIIMLTDANIFFDSLTIKENVKRYADPKVGLVGSLVSNLSSFKDGMVVQEKNYISWENNIKFNEGRIWGCTIAPFGACLSFRKELFKPIPINFLVDDFFISSTVLQAKMHCVIERKSVCYEEINGFLMDEYIRRKRISTGNIQNFKRFFSLFTNILKPVGFCFWSHKGLRWLTPFFLIYLFFTNIFLFQQEQIYQILMISQLVFYCIPLTVSLNSKYPTFNKLVKFVHYFLMMNLALLVGYTDYLKGVKVGYWEVTQR